MTANSRLHGRILSQKKKKKPGRKGRREEGKEKISQVLVSASHTIT
jgi:hypothetical protein